MSSLFFMAVHTKVGMNIKLLSEVMFSMTT